MENNEIDFKELLTKYENTITVKESDVKQSDMLDGFIEIINPYNKKMDVVIINKEKRSSFSLLVGIDFVEINNKVYTLKNKVYYNVKTMELLLSNKKYISNIKSSKKIEDDKMIIEILHNNNEADEKAKYLFNKCKKLEAEIKKRENDIQNLLSYLRIANEQILKYEEILEKVNTLTNINVDV